MPDYSLRIFELNYLIKENLPDLFYHFKKQQINPDIFFSKWILTIFASYLSFPTLAVVWDVFLIDGWKAIFKFSLAFLKEMKGDIINMDLNSFSKHLRENSKFYHTDIKHILTSYKEFKVSNKTLNELREDFYLEQIQRKLENSASVWDPDQLEGFDLYKIDLENINIEHKEKIKFLQSEYQKCSSLLNKRTEHYIEQGKKCNLAKNKVEELVESKSAFENVINLLNKEILSMSSFNGINNKYISDDNFEVPKHKSKSKSSKKSLLTVKKKLETVNIKLVKYNQKLLDNFKLLEEKQFTMEACREEKEKIKNEIEFAINQYELSKKEIMKHLLEKLRLCERFVKSSQF